MNLDNEYVNSRIKSYQGREEKWYGELGKELLEEFERILKGFINPETGKPVMAAEFLSWLVWKNIRKYLPSTIRSTKEKGGVELLLIKQ